MTKSFLFVRIHLRRGGNMQYENHLENYLYEGVLQTSIVPISYHSYDGKKRGQEIASFLTFYPDFFEQFFQGKIEAINMEEQVGIQSPTVVNIPVRKKPYDDMELMSIFTTFMEDAPKEKVGYQKVLKNENRTTVNE